jgi:hypothetical protein
MQIFFMGKCTKARGGSKSMRILSVVNVHYTD